MLLPVLLLVCFSSINALIDGVNSRSLRKGDVDPPMKYPLRLYGMRFCPWCQRAMIYFYKKNMTVDIVNINLNSKPQFFVKKNPDGRVPVLQHKERTMSDSAIICEYLDNIAPETSILPINPKAREQEKANAAQLQKIAFIAYYAIVEGQKEPAFKKDKQNLLKIASGFLDSRLTDLFYTGKTVGYADYLTYPFVERLWIWSHVRGATGFDDYPGSTYPKLKAWFERMNRLPEVAKSRQPLASHLIFNEGYVRDDPNYDA